MERSSVPHGPVAAMAHNEPARLIRSPPCLVTWPFHVIMRKGAGNVPGRNAGPWEALTSPIKLPCAVFASVGASGGAPRVGAQRCWVWGAGAQGAGAQWCGGRCVQWCDVRG